MRAGIIVDTGLFMEKSDIRHPDYDSIFARFDALMPFKVKDILLVSSLYDSFILEEDGYVADLVFSEYTEFNLSFAPQIKRVSSGEEALELLQKKKFDLIIVFRRLSDIDIISFGKKARQIVRDISIILLAFQGRELQIAEQRQYRDVVDRAFLWSGETNILLAIVKYVEDKRNVDFDTRLIGVRVIILIEDSVRFYSAYLPLIYAEILRQTQNLMADGLNLPQRLLRQRARPKILLADSYEEAWRLFEKYQEFLLGIISDISFSNKGEPDDKAGLKLVKEAKERINDLPVLLQSNNLENAELARRSGVSFIYKNSASLLSELRSFIKNNFGFGDFIFRKPDGTEITRARDFVALEKCLETVPGESLIYHGKRNHFSNWLMARSEFDLAKRLRPRKVSEFEDTTALRNYLISTIKSFRHEQQLGIVTDFSRRQFDRQFEFVKLGDGSLGGKGRGLAFISRLLRKYNIYRRFEGVSIMVPPSAIIGTSVYDEFIMKNNLLEYALEDRSDDQIGNAFLSARLPRGILSDLKAFLEEVNYPIAVRSSSLLEDSHYQPFAGIFETHMLPNNSTDIKARLDRLEAAIKCIYSSIFYRNSKTYIEATGNRVEEEKMAVIVQKVVGRERNRSFYPVLSGIGRSYNFYSVGHIKPEEGVAYVALGLGKTINEGGNCLYFSPANPHHLPQFSSPKEFLCNAQYEFYAIDMSDPRVYPKPGGNAGLVRRGIDQAESDGTLAYVGSTYSPDNDRVYDGTNRAGIKMVTFAPILKSRIFPLDEIIRFLLQLGHSAFTTPIEIEFAAELNSQSDHPHEFAFLQIRPMAADTFLDNVDIDQFEADNILCKSDESLSNGRINSINDIVYIRRDTFDRSQMADMAMHVSRLNEYLKKAGRPYILLGPGRWGTADRWLGIPASWDQISGARVIIEATYGDFSVTPSFGTHFFQNLIAFQIGYLTVNKTDANNMLDWEWLESRPISQETEFLRHVSLGEPLEVIIDGRSGKAVILKSQS
jgi:hypothetical protein